VFLFETEALVFLA
jgi:hypothetical protein